MKTSTKGGFCGCGCDDTSVIKEKVRVVGLVRMHFGEISAV